MSSTRNERGLVVAVDAAKAEVTLTSGVTYHLPNGLFDAAFLGQMILLQVEFARGKHTVTHVSTVVPVPLSGRPLENFPAKVRTKLEARALAGDIGICFGGPTFNKFSVRLKSGEVFVSNHFKQMTHVAPMMHEFRHAWNAAGGKMLVASTDDVAFWRNFFDLLPE